VNKFIRFFHYRLSLALTILIFLFFAISFGKEFFRRHDIQKEIHALEQEVKNLETISNEQEKWQQLLQTEFYVEREARLKLGLAKPKEQVIIITDESLNINDQNKEQSLKLNHSQLESDQMNSGTFFSSTSSSIWYNPIAWWHYFF